MAAAQTLNTFCRICEALCGLEVDVEEGARITAIRPDRQHVATQGYGCIKGLRQHELYGSPDRLTVPLRRSPRGILTPTTWPEAMRGIGTEVKRIVRDHGGDAVAMYVGTAAGFGTLHPAFAQGFMDGVGSRSMYASASQDCSNKFAVARLMYGFPFLQPFPDVDQTQCLIVVGANPAISKWSFLQVAHPIRRLKEIQARGAKLWFVDPRRTESTKVAGDHVFIRPGTDVYFYLSFLRELIASGGVDRDRVARHTRGFEHVAALVAPWTPERTAEVTRIPPATLRAMVDAYRTADGAALYSSTGVNMGGFGALGFWLQEVINAVSGNLDRRGGTLVGHGIFDFPRWAHRQGILMRDDRSRIGGFSAVNDTYPGGLLADEILTPGDRQVKALFVTGGNPLLTMANAGRLREALAHLELLVVLDILPTETASAAHYVLPCTSPLQRPDLPFIFPLMLGLQSRPYLQATDAVLPAEGEQRDEASIYIDLCHHCDAPIFGSRVAQAVLRGVARAVGRWQRSRYGKVPERALLDLLLRLTGQPSFAALVDARHGWLRPDHRGNDFLGARVLTDDGRVDLAPARLLATAEGLASAFEAERRDRTRLKLITRRAVTTHNSWTHNHPRFSRDGTNFLYLHPDDAAARGLGPGDIADVTSTTATVRIPVRLLDDLMPGTVALPHGWGHQSAKGLGVASRNGGVNVNLLAADGPAALEAVSGMAKLTGILVDVARADGPRDPDDWSGLPAESRV
ncbi:MAG: molybdopterin-dependent oxidoreductase [Myxococcota bacterium]